MQDQGPTSSQQELGPHFAFQPLPFDFYDGWDVQALRLVQNYGFDSFLGFTNHPQRMNNVRPFQTHSDLSLSSKVDDELLQMALAVNRRRFESGLCASAGRSVLPSLLNGHLHRKRLSRSVSIRKCFLIGRWNEDN